MSRWLISVAELAKCCQHENVVVVDCRFALADPLAGEQQYAAGHIPGSRYAHLDRDLSGPRALHGGRHPLPTLSELTAVFSRLGINSNPPSLVVAYDDSKFAFAARLWWLLRYCGHDNVRVLDGGYSAWRASKLPMDAELPPPETGAFMASPRAEMAIDINAVKRVAVGKNADSIADTVLIDSREAPRFLGLEEPIDPVAGHIAGARNYPWQQVSSDVGLFNAPDDQRVRWGDIATAKNIVVYCGSGVTACVNLLSLAEIGREDAQLYAGSWSDWCSYL
ncbi:MAG TPA: sulfurtransferase [Spongiibacteraceae bacterium]|nr:sulfurtransferase [Spongiibacteraceae bacterium]